MKMNMNNGNMSMSMQNNNDSPGSININGNMNNSSVMSVNGNVIMVKDGKVYFNGERMYTKKQWKERTQKVKR